MIVAGRMDSDVVPAVKLALRIVDIRGAPREDQSAIDIARRNRGLAELA